MLCNFTKNSEKNLILFYLFTWMFKYATLEMYWNVCKPNLCCSGIQVVKKEDRGNFQIAACSSLWKERKGIALWVLVFCFLPSLLPYFSQGGPGIIFSLMSIEYSDPLGIIAGSICVLDIFILNFLCIEALKFIFTKVNFFLRLYFELDGIIFNIFLGLLSPRANGCWILEPFYVFQLLLSFLVDVNVQVSFVTQSLPDTVLACC